MPLHLSLLLTPADQSCYVCLNPVAATVGASVGAASTHTTLTTSAFKQLS
jgi:hypothetical protein